MGRRMNRHFSKEDTQITNKHMNTEHKLNITNHEEMQIKPKMECHLTPVRMTLSRKTMNDKHGEDVEKSEP